MANRISLIVSLIITYIVILILGFVFYNLIIRPVEGADTTNAIVGILGWSATLYAPIAAFILLDNWKVQKNYELKKEYICSILLKLNQILPKILAISTISKNIIGIRSELIIRTKYLHYDELLIGDIIINLFADIKVFSYLTNNKEILNLYHSLEMHAFFIDHIHTQQIKIYTSYYNKFLQLGSVSEQSNYNLVRSYTPTEAKELKSFSLLTNHLLESKQRYEKFILNDINNSVETLEYLSSELFDECLELHNNIQNICFKYLKVD